MNSNARMYCTGVLVRAVAGVALLLVLFQSSRAQTVVATVPLPVAGEPWAVAVDPVTDNIYVVGGGVSIIDGHTDAVATVPHGLWPLAVAVNSVTNKIYVANRGDLLKNEWGSVMVIDGATGSTSAISIDSPYVVHPAAIAVNPETDKVYVAHVGNSVTVIDGATNATTTFGIDDSYGLNVAVAVNPATDKIYFSSGNSQNLWIIDGPTNALTSVPIVTAGNFEGPFGITVNTATNRIYVASGAVTMIDGDTNSTTEIIDPNAIGAGAVAVNSVTNKIYVANQGNYPNSNHGNITVIDGATNSTTTITDPKALAPLSIAVNPVTDRIYVANANSSTLSGNGGVTVIDGASNAFATVVDPNAKTDQPAAIAIDATTDRIYVANAISDNVTVINGDIPIPFSTPAPSVVSSGDPSDGGSHGGGGGVDWLTLWSLLGCVFVAVRRAVVLP